MSFECAPHERTSPAQIMHHTLSKTHSITHTHTEKEERQPTPATNSRTQMATAMKAGGATAAACTTALQQAGRTCINGMHSSSATPRSSSSLSSNFLCTRSLQSGPIMQNNTMRASSRPSLLVARAAAKLPTGVEPPKEEPKLPILFWGFTENAEVWNSRAAMIGLFGIIAVEAIINKGILQLLGIEIGKGLDLPL